MGLAESESWGRRRGRRRQGPKEGHAHLSSTAGEAAAAPVTPVVSLAACNALRQGCLLFLVAARRGAAGVRARQLPCAARFRGVPWVSLWRPLLRPSKPDSLVRLWVLVSTGKHVQLRRLHGVLHAVLRLRPPMRSGKVPDAKLLRLDQWWRPHLYILPCREVSRLHRPNQLLKLRRGAVQLRWSN